jgi:hypothetical protein
MPLLKNMTCRLNSIRLWGIHKKSRKCLHMSIFTYPEKKLCSSHLWNKNLLTAMENQDILLVTTCHVVPSWARYLGQGDHGTEQTLWSRQGPWENLMISGVRSLAMHVHLQPADEPSGWRWESQICKDPDASLSRHLTLGAKSQRTASQASMAVSQ